MKETQKLIVIDQQEKNGMPRGRKKYTEPIHKPIKISDEGLRKETKDGKCDCCRKETKLTNSARALGFSDIEEEKGLNIHPHIKMTWECDECRPLSDRRFIEIKHDMRK